MVGGRFAMCVKNGKMYIVGLAFVLLLNGDDGSTIGAKSDGRTIIQR